MRLTQTTVERSLYLLLILMFMVNIGIGYEVISVQTVQNRNHTHTNATLLKIQQQNACFTEFFLQPNRADITIANLGKVCEPVIKGQ